MRDRLEHESTEYLESIHEDLCSHFHHEPAVKTYIEVFPSHDAFSARITGSPAGIAPRSDVPTLSTGDSVRHETLGEGVVTAVEAGGVVMVRFAADGSERRLMLDYAPLEKL